MRSDDDRVTLNEWSHSREHKVRGRQSKSCVVNMAGQMGTPSVRSADRTVLIVLTRRLN